MTYDKRITDIAAIAAVAAGKNAQVAPQLLTADISFTLADAVADGRLMLGTSLTFEALRAANMLRCVRWHPEGINSWSLSDWGVASAGEMGEALNVVKKLNRERDSIAGNTASVDELRSQLADEIADTVIYLDIMAASEGINLAQAIASKFNRTSERVGFPERLPARGEAA